MDGANAFYLVATNAEESGFQTKQDKALSLDCAERKAKNKWTHCALQIP